MLLEKSPMAKTERRTKLLLQKMPRLVEVLLPTEMEVLLPKLPKKKALRQVDLPHLPPPQQHSWFHYYYKETESTVSIALPFALLSFASLVQRTTTESGHDRWQFQ